MAISSVKVTFICPIEKIWGVVTNLSDQSWRSDIKKVDVIDEMNFIEYTKDDFKTMFKTTNKQQNKIWEFSIENKNIVGLWSGKFYKHEGTTTLDFTENIKAKKIF